METLSFWYYLLRRSSDPAEPPVNVIAVAAGTGPTQAVIWDRPKNAWTFRPDVAAAILWANPERHETELVDRETARRQAAHFTSVALPSEVELTRICQAAGEARRTKVLELADIVRFEDAPPPPGESPWVKGEPEPKNIAIVAPDPRWPAHFDHLARLIHTALGPLALDLEHIGSTSVPGLPAKPVIDIDLTVPDSADENAWLPPLETAGFVLVIREPWWYEHRCLTFAAPRANLHVFSPGCPEAARHKIFRDWLRDHPEDLARYRDVKLAAADAANAAGEHVMQYNARKQQVIREIYHRAFTAAGLLP